MGTRHEARWRGHPRLTTFPFGPVWPSIPVTPWMRLKKETKCRRINNAHEENPTQHGSAPCLPRAREWHMLGKGTGLISNKS